jgi:hypothetical protein
MRGSATISGGLSLFFAGFAGLALTFSADAAMMPLVVGVPALLLSLLQFRDDLARSGAEGASTQKGQFWNPVAIRLGWFSSLVLASILLGILPASWIFIGAYLYVFHRSSVLRALSIATAFSLAIYTILSHFLGLTLFTGLFY